jgi:hypothetical protein
MNPVKKHPVLGVEFVDEGDNETLDAVLSGVDRGLAEKKRREAAVGIKPYRDTASHGVDSGEDGES